MYVPNLNFTWTLRNNFSHFQKGPQKKSSRVLDPLNFTWTPRNYFLHFQKGPQKFSWTPRILEPALPLLSRQWISYSLVLLIMLLRSLWHIALSMSMIWRLLKLAQLTNPAKSTRMCRTWMLGLMTTTSCSTQGSVRSCKFASNGTRRAPQASKLQVLILRRCLKPSFLVLLSSLILAGSPKLITWWPKVVVGCIC